MSRQQTWMDNSPFFAKMDADPNAVYVVECYKNQERVRLAIFGSQILASQWMDKQDDETTCVCAPYVINEPDFGNVPKERQS